MERRGGIEEGRRDGIGGESKSKGELLEINR